MKSKEYVLPLLEDITLVSQNKIIDDMTKRAAKLFNQRSKDGNVKESVFKGVMKEVNGYYVSICNKVNAHYETELLDQNRFKVCTNISLMKNGFQFKI